MTLSVFPIDIYITVVTYMSMVFSQWNENKHSWFIWVHCVSLMFECRPRFSFVDHEWSRQMTCVTLTAKMAAVKESRTFFCCRVSHLYKLSNLCQGAGPNRNANFSVYFQRFLTFLSEGFSLNLQFLRGKKIKS